MCIVVDHFSYICSVWWVCVWQSSRAHSHQKRPSSRDKCLLFSFFSTSHAHIQDPRVREKRNKEKEQPQGTCCFSVWEGTVTFPKHQMKSLVRTSTSNNRAFALSMVDGVSKLTKRPKTSQLNFQRSHWAVMANRNSYPRIQHERLNRNYWCYHSTSLLKSHVRTYLKTLLCTHYCQQCTAVTNPMIMCSDGLPLRKEPLQWVHKSKIRNFS